MEKEQDKIISDVTTGEYKYGFYSDIEADSIQKGLNEDIIRIISQKKNEPDWLLDFRLKAFRHWQTMKMPQPFHRYPCAFPNPLSHECRRRNQYGRHDAGR